MAIFDMDGVLVDSEPFGFEALRRVMARYGLGYSEEENAEFLGRTTLDSCRILRARHLIPESEETLADWYVEGMLEQIARGPIPMAGVPEVLRSVRAAGYRMALASSAELRVIDANLAALSLRPLFEAVVSGTQVPRGKPAPDVFLAAAERQWVGSGRLCEAAGSVCACSALRNYLRPRGPPVPRPRDGVRRQGARAGKRGGVKCSSGAPSERAMSVVMPAPPSAMASVWMKCPS